jgi:ABC-type antimicrobial peptide transport system permease subunit
MFLAGITNGNYARNKRRMKSVLEESAMLKFLGGTIGVIFLIGLIVVVLLLMLIF